MKRVSQFVVILATVIAVALVPLGHAFAYSFNQNKIIDDSIFDNSGSMGTTTINNWLNANFPQSCISTNNGFSAPDPIGYDSSQGFIYGGNVSAGQVITDAAQAYNINPQVLIATLEKESSVVSGSASYHCNYINTAMGYGCPDSGSCPTDPATMSGFSKQVIHAAWLLKFGEQRSEGNTGWEIVKGGWNNSDDPGTCYGGPMTQGTLSRGCGQAATYFDGYTTIDGTAVHMDDGATAALYWYTPHFHGNQLFFNIFTGWFGPTLTNCVYPPAVTNGLYRLYNPATGGQFLTSSPDEVCTATMMGFLYDGQVFMSASSSTIPVYRLQSNGKYLYTTSTAERDFAISYGFKLEGIAFYADDPSTDPSNARPVYRLSNASGAYTYTISGSERDNLESSGYHYEGIGFYLLENSGATVTPTYRLHNSTGSYLYTISTQERDSAVQNVGYTYEGVGFNAITQMNSLSVPVYRLSTGNGYLFTTSIKERANAVQVGYKNEGIGMYTYGFNDPSFTPIYRLSNPNRSYLFTSSGSERDWAAANAWYLKEGTGFETP